MSLSEFPFCTGDAKAEVTLPIGTHVLRLIVIDDAGTISQADTVTITVKKQAEPHITYLDPAEGQRGRRIEAAIIGTNLQDVLAIKVFRHDHQDDRVTVTVCDGATAERVPIVIHIYDHAHLGLRTLEVTTTHGVATVPFTVASGEAPCIIAITPTGGSLGLSYNIPARIAGDHLEKAQEVSFRLNGQPDDTIKAKVHQATKDFVDLDLRITAEAVLGNRTFTVTTPNGTTSSPPGITFQVGPGPVQIGVIMLTLITALIHLALNFPHPLFILNGLGYLTLLYFYYWPTRVLWGQHAPLRWLFIGYTAVTVIAWFVPGVEHNLLGYITKAIELGLIGLLLVESYLAQRKVVI